MASQFVSVKKEEEQREWSGVSEAAARAGLYVGHDVKQEVVLGPELLQPPDVAYTCQDNNVKKHVLENEPFEFYATTTAITPENTIQPSGSTNPTELAVELQEQSDITAERQSRAKPCQEAMQKKIDLLEKNLNALYSVRETIPNHLEVERQIYKFREELKRAKQTLKRKIRNAAAQKKHRDNLKRKLEDICHENPDIKKKLAIRDSAGRPSLENDQPLLLKAIADIAGSEELTRSESDVIHSAKTLDELTKELQRLGFDISRSATYLRLLPRKSNSAEGRRHISTVPVKLARAQTDHPTHIDNAFAETSIRYLETVASILGPGQVFYVAHYDKARIPLDLNPTNKEAPLLMHMEHRLNLPDSDWVNSERHKLIPSVYAGIKILPDMLGQVEAVSNSGPTFVAIRSGKLNSSTTNTNAEDFETLVNLEEFRSLVKTDQGLVKPVVIMIVDGGPDVSPRYVKMISFAVEQFKKYDLDALFIATNAPQANPYDRVQHKIARLGRELSNLILPRTHFDPLDNSDDNLRDAHFQFAGTVLAEVWGSITIDECRVSAKYVESNGQESSVSPDGEWYSNHVRESRYLLQIVKCKNANCCRTRSALFTLLRDGFLPPPVKMKQTPDFALDESGQFLDLPLRLALRLNLPKEFLHLPYDYFCPTVKSELRHRICEICGLYHASVKSLNRHKRIHGITSTPHIGMNVKPVTVLARRGKELMCLIQTSDKTHDVEWIEKTE